MPILVPSNLVEWFLNNPPILLFLLTGFFIALACIISLIRYYRQKYVQFLYWSLHMFSISAWALLTTVGIIFTIWGDSETWLSFRILDVDYSWTFSTTLGYIGFFLKIPMLFFLILFVDSISQTSIEPRKMVGGGMIAAALIITGMSPGQATQDILLSTYYAEALHYFFVVFLWLYYGLKIFLNAPNVKIKRVSLLVLLGALLVGVDAFFTFFRVFEWWQPGTLPSATFMISGLLLMTLIYTSVPQILYILPFKASSLTVISDNGIPLFTYSWVQREDPASEVLFSGMMIGISTILKESLQKGFVREIALDQSKLLLERDTVHSITFVLVSTKTTKSLVDALILFAERFVTNFKENLDEYVITPEVFSDANLLVSECFPFLPEYQ